MPWQVRQDGAGQVDWATGDRRNGGSGSVIATRRLVLMVLGALTLPGAALAASAPARAAPVAGAGAFRPSDLPISAVTLRQEAAPDHAEHVAAAFEQRRRAAEWGDQPFGAVIVQRGGVVGEGPSRVVLLGDPTAHAEMEAIRDACRRLGTRDLSDCVLYATSQPCRMCEAAAYWARVSQIYHGSTGVGAGPPRLASC